MGSGLVDWNQKGQLYHNTTFGKKKKKKREEWLTYRLLQACLD
jgi:hypothetical protein